MKHDELLLEKQCRAYARSKGWAAWKNEKNGCTGIPDDSFLSPDGSIFLLVEFKKDDKSPLRHEQKVWKNRYPDVVFIISSLESFKKLID